MTDIHGVPEIYGLRLTLDGIPVPQVPSEPAFFEEAKCWAICISYRGKSCKFTTLDDFWAAVSSLQPVGIDNSRSASLASR